MRFSILHISDLHRDLRDELANGPLLESMVRDVDRFQRETPAISRPSLCVVSGDLIFGVSPQRTGWESELNRQYAQAAEFLISLADALFEGDRERIVIVPGNHDVSYPTVISSSKRIDVPEQASERRVLTDELFAPLSRLRWSWAEMCFFRITDADLYERRLLGFSKAYNEFYLGKRSYSMVPQEQFDIFDFPSLDFSIAALNSCYRNDPLHRAGSFHPTTLSAVSAELRKPYRTGWLLAATWHHSLGGSVAENDSLGHESVQYLIDSGVSIGFHGHQHAHDCIDERYRFGPDKRKMTIISASTLCAEPGNLKPGIPRGYNVVEINTDDWSGRVHARRMVNETFNLPLWGPGQFNVTGRPFVDFELNRPLVKRPADLDRALLLERAEDLLSKKQWKQAIAALEDLPDEPLTRPLLIAGLDELGDDMETLRVLWPPRSNQEIVMVGTALLALEDQIRAKEFLKLENVSESIDASVIDLKRRITFRWMR
jgi:hypothetical protein